MRLRSMRSRGKQADLEDFLSIDESAGFLDKDDLKALKKGIGEAKSARGSHKDYKDDLQKKRNDMKKSGRPVPAGGSLMRPGSSPMMPRSSEIPQPVAKELSPNQSYIWQNRGDHAWMGRYQTNPMVSRSWEYHGDRQACIFVLRELWSQALDEVGLEEKDCPISGLFCSTAADTLLPVSEPASSSSAPAASVNSGSGGHGAGRARGSAANARAAEPEAPAAPAAKRRPGRMNVVC